MALITKPGNNGNSSTSTKNTIIKKYDQANKATRVDEYGKKNIPVTKPLTPYGNAGVAEFNPDGTVKAVKVDGKYTGANAAMLTDYDKHNAYINRVRETIQKNYNLDPNTFGKDDTIDPQAVFPEGHPQAGQRMLPDKMIENFHKSQDWKQNVYRPWAGYTQKNFGGDIEGQNKSTSEVKWGPRMIFGSQYRPAPAPKMQRGGILNKPKKKTLSYQKGADVTISVAKVVSKEVSPKKGVKSLGKFTKRGVKIVNKTK